MVKKLYYKDNVQVWEALWGKTLIVNILTLGGKERVMKE